MDISFSILIKTFFNRLNLIKLFIPFNKIITDMDILSCYEYNMEELYKLFH